MGGMQKPTDQAPLTARLFSLEILIWMMGVVFAAGVGYKALAKDTIDNTSAIDETQASVALLALDVSDIKISLEGINQTRKAEALAVELRAKVVDRRMDDMKDDIKSVLRILQQANK